MDKIFVTVFGSIGLLLAVLFYFGHQEWKAEKTSCKAYCAPKQSMARSRYKSSTDCYCKVEGGFLIQDPSEWNK